ncbi:MAG: XdhC family protein, partial [Ktedonobacterales bacterium]|nr:XdhC family protein [Ktedonobacterales bacterium]
GGCVEPAVIEQGLRTLRTGQPALLSFGITEEQNVERIGLSCGGEISVFVERLEESAALVAALRAERPLARATVIATAGEARVPLGASALIAEAGEARGSLGLAELDAAVAVAARARLRQGVSVTEAFALAGGASCEVFFAVSSPPPLLIIIGAGHIAIPLTRMAKVLGYRVVVVDARAAFATRARLPDADDLLVEWPDEALAHLPLTSATAVAVLTHDDKFDVPALRVALASPAGYVGAIGSRDTRRERDERLRAAGVTDERIGRIHGPIGLDIGARTPEEIALAILAEMVAARRM